MSDKELRDRLKVYGLDPGPITDSTRPIYRKKLESLLADESKMDMTTNSMSSARVSARQSDLSEGSARVSPRKSDLSVLTGPPLLDESSDEDFVVDEEDLEDESSSISDEESVDDVDEIKASSTTQSKDTSNTSLIQEPKPENGLSRYILTTLISLLIIIFSYYLISRTDSYGFQSNKNLYKLLHLAVVACPLILIAIKSVNYLQNRRRKETELVCKLVGEALELLQSPDNPKGLMPILHIRDTLFSPAERKSKKNTELWAKAVEFVEDHESRVKVELVNIEGEDFRAWKWIGSRKI